MSLKRGYILHIKVMFIEITLHRVYSGRYTSNSNWSLLLYLWVADLDLLVQELSIAQLKWEGIGRELGMKQDTLNDICTNYSDLGGCLKVMLKEKLKRDWITWKHIITILRTPCIAESNLADQLEGKYCPSEQLSMILIMH